ncbi:hypothetical protein LTR56_023389 [Elasticomyces elasticus]|nr:hypothetical protein LTR56_023389 [Elasticomyces elasticus]KAK3635087.1 hypothetical protein LTR22_019368 [Elasticomyces elasticus]KAK4906764.1 hypothetical protein LTR49_024136 [Elasticomyces elasticus]KAK5769313.1 hypothetical protein LTS12_000665 [Elasticomyces elasticus]
MIVNGAILATQGIIALNYRGSLMPFRPDDPQIHARHVDLTIREIVKYEREGKGHKWEATDTIPWNEASRHVHLELGYYRVEFNEVVKMPDNYAGTIKSDNNKYCYNHRARIFTDIRCGYEGPLRALFSVNGIGGIDVFERSKLAQMVFYRVK